MKETFLPEKKVQNFELEKAVEQEAHIESVIARFDTRGFSAQDLALVKKAFIETIGILPTDTKESAIFIGVNSPIHFNEKALPEVFSNLSAVTVDIDSPQRGASFHLFWNSKTPEVLFAYGEGKVGNKFKNFELECQINDYQTKTGEDVIADFLK